MNNTIFDIDFTRALPPTLKNDEDMLALAKVVAEELQTTAHLSRLNLIYARIDELEENLLDILAYDFHVDWYSYDYPIEAKRAVIKDSVKVHKRLGTLYAVKTALGSVYPQSEVEEWFDYNGNPFSFRVVLDVTNSKAPAEYFAIKKAVDSYKRLTAHMDDLIYQCQTVIQIPVQTEFFYLSVTMTGKNRSGIYPQRNIKGRLASANVNVISQGGEFLFASTQAGTKPYRSTIGMICNGIIQSDGRGMAFHFTAGSAGQYKTGVEPQRNIGTVFNTTEVEANTEGRGYTFSSPRVGAEPQRNIGTIFIATEVETETQGCGYVFTSTQVGTEPHSNTKSNYENSGIIPSVVIEGFSFRAKWCGTTRCKNKKKEKGV